MVLDEKNGKCAQELIARKDIQDSVSCLSLHSTFAATWNDTSDGNFYSGSVVRNPAASAGNMGSILDLEDPTCQRAPKPVRHNSWAYALEPGSQNFWACESQNLCSQQVKPLHWETFTPQLESNPHSPQLRKTYVWQWRPSMTKTK